jgi:endonuclease VIII
MPEGPSIFILREDCAIFEGKKILEVSGNSKIEQKRVLGKKPVFKSWGKHFLVCFPGFYLRIHLLMFGSALVNKRKEHLVPRLSLRFKNGEFNFYSCALRLNEGNPEEHYDWTVDTLSDKWDYTKALKTVKKMKTSMACDLLLDQNIFAGSGNIVKVEVLWRTRLHPENKIANIPAAKLKELVKAVPDYCKDFYRWKKAFVLRQHWECYRKQICPRCNLKYKLKKTGETNRRTFFCSNCQILYKKKKAEK